MGAIYTGEDLFIEIGFIWDKQGHHWKENYERLRELKTQHGHCNAVAFSNGKDKTFGP